MKTRSIIAQISTGAGLALLSFGISNAHASSPTPVPNTGPIFQYQYRPVAWEHSRVEKLQHAYHLLEHAEADYGGHKGLAMKEIKKASDVLGVEVHGNGHWAAEEGQWNSDRHLREAKHLLEDVSSETGGGEEQAHLHKAIKEIDRALAIH